MTFLSSERAMEFIVSRTGMFCASLPARNGLYHIRVNGQTLKTPESVHAFVKKYSK